MVWQPEIDELNRRKQLAAQMGGPEGVERQHKRGKLTVRERIAKLADPGSFQEIGSLAGSATYEDDKLVAVCSQRKWDALGWLNIGHFRGLCPAPWQSYYSPFLPLMSCF
jgi:hypothetical protein